MSRLSPRPGPGRRGVSDSRQHFRCEKTSHFGPPRSRLAARRPARGAGGTCAAMRRAGRCCGVRCGERRQRSARSGYPRPVGPDLDRTRHTATRPSRPVVANAAPPHRIGSYRSRPRITFYYWLNTLCTLRPNRPISTMTYTRFAQTLRQARNTRPIHARARD